LVPDEELDFVEPISFRVSGLHGFASDLQPDVLSGRRTIEDWDLNELTSPLTHEVERCGPEEISVFRREREKSNSDLNPVPLRSVPFGSSGRSLMSRPDPENRKSPLPIRAVHS
jgi:hypothetical protein